MHADPARFEALVGRFMKLGGADRRAVLASLTPDERDLFERELAAARDEQRRDRDRPRLADRQFVGYSPWLAAIIGSAIRDDGGDERTRAEACNKAIVLAHRAATEQPAGEGPFSLFLRQLGIPGFAADVDEPQVTVIPRQLATGRPVALFRAAHGTQAAAVRETRTAADDSVADDGAELAARRIAELEEALLLEREERKKACEAAFAEGRSEGLAQATARDGERFDLLREAIERASSECAATIEKRADLAVTIARAALQRVFGEHWQHSGMVEAVIRHDTQQLSADSIVRVRVSADDFADAASLRDLAAARGVDIERDAQLTSGACLFDCTLGTIDASIPLQAQALDELLSRLAPGTGGAA